MSRPKRRVWPTLSKLDIKRLSKRPETPDVIRKLLEPTKAFENESGSSYSDISDIFEEFHRESYFNCKKSGKKHISKYEADVLTMGEFTDDFKNIMKITKSSLQNHEDMINENIETIDKTIKSAKRRNELPDHLKAQIKQILEEPDVTPEIDIGSTTPRKVSDESSNDYMSGIWSMLDAHCQDTKFRISPMNFDVYNQQEPHWLQRPQVSHEVIEESKLKCQTWLNKCNG